jgi:hypothetical protein
LLLTQIVSISLIFMLARYRLVAVSCLILFASFFLLQLVEQLRARNPRALAISLATLCATSALVHIPFAEFGPEHDFSGKLKRIEKLSAGEENPSTSFGVGR